MISVIIPVYNREKTVERAIRSVLNQTYNDLEVIVVDDGSSDKTMEIVGSIKDERVICYQLENNSGACAARNKGIELAHGEYIAFQDSDDEWLPEKAEEQLRSMRANHAMMSFCQFKRIDEKGENIFPNLSAGFVSRDQLLQESIVSTQTIIGRRECFVQIKFDPEMPRMQDYDICIRLSEKYNFYFIDKPLVNMYIQNDSISTNWDKLLIALEKICEKYKSTMKKNKNMDFYQTRYLALAKEKTGRNSTKERLHCFVLRPSWGTLKKVVKSALSFRVI